MARIFKTVALAKMIIPTFQAWDIKLPTFHFSLGCTQRFDILPFQGRVIGDINQICKTYP
jgi:hypothetical protein